MCHLYATDPDFRLRGQNACDSVSRQSLPHQCLATLSRHVHPRAHTCTHVHPRASKCMYVPPRASGLDILFLSYFGFIFTIAREVRDFPHHKYLI